MDKPFEELGLTLKDIRHKKRETIAEVSMAVEIDMEAMARIENGQDRPSEEVLMLLISHFDVQDDQAVRLWSLAKYDRSNGSDMDSSQQRTVVMLMAIDTRVLYSDSANVSVSKNGVIMNFLQSEGDNPNTVARIGMSQEQARNVLDGLKEALDQAHLVQQPKALPAQITKRSPKKTKKS